MLHYCIFCSDTAHTLERCKASQATQMPPLRPEDIWGVKISKLRTSQSQSIVNILRSENICVITIFLTTNLLTHHIASHDSSAAMLKIHHCVSEKAIQ